jgi:B12-binding domain/radical SAM domain protein
MIEAIAFKYCGEGCGTDFYYGYSVEQTIGAIEISNELSSFPIILFDNIAELKEKVASFDRVFAIYLFRSVHAPEAFSESLELKRDAKFVTIGAGAHPSGDPLGTIQYLDYAVVGGDCEIAIRELLSCLIEEKEPQIRGVWYSKDREIISGGRAKFVDLNAIPPFAPKQKLFAPIEITRGCPVGCKFCCVQYIYGEKQRHRSVEEIVKWVKVAKEGGMRVINFLTPNAFSYGSDSGRNPKKIRKDEIEELLITLARIKDVKIIFGNYLSNVRPDFVSDDLIELVKKYTQTPTIHMGGQSGSNRILEISRVGYTVEDIRKAVSIVRNARLNASVDFIFGLPGETETDRKETLQLIKELVAVGAKPRIHAFMPLPGTPFHDQPHGKVPGKYRALFQKWAIRKQVMIPFEYEEISCNTETELLMVHMISKNSFQKNL